MESDSDTKTVTVCSSDSELRLNPEGLSIKMAKSEDRRCISPEDATEMFHKEERAERDFCRVSKHFCSHSSTHLPRRSRWLTLLKSSTEL